MILQLRSPATGLPPIRSFGRNQQPTRAEPEGQPQPIGTHRKSSSSTRRTRAVPQQDSRFYLAQPLTTVIGAPLAGWLISADGILGLEGWRFMYFGVAIPAIVVGVVAWFYLVDKPADAKWLTRDEQVWLTDSIAADAKGKTGATGHGNVRAALTSGRVWVMSAI